MYEQTIKDLLKGHSSNFIEMALQTDRMERINRPHAYSKKTGDCGDTVEFFLLGSKEKITNIFFMVDGCMNTVACCNTVAKFVQGKSVEDAWSIKPEQVIEFLETLPEDHHHCAELAVGTFYLALVNLSSRQSWQY